MKTVSAPAEVNIHLRARAHDKALIDQAAGLLGANRSQFVMASALREAKNVILDQASIEVNHQIFQEILEGLDAPATPEQIEGMKRLRDAELPWPHE